ncbi:hypothetical protein EUGRSUZ_I02277 [Eucalyptus grandis]|uniref:Uncharacterized protein n=2 Tax=Eucalyptus grandis TaxID=71139 RepID=A0ACC3JIQ4_EUCGR|nr:hypothetical protein EUGRSUZ_I02277 [Eucalyptus grandis]
MADPYLIYNYHVRSTCFPSRSHPTTLRIFGLINKLESSRNKASTSSSGSVFAGLLGLEGLLDFCDYSGQTLLHLKEHMRVLQSALRRRRGEPVIETGVEEYANFKKRMKKDAKRLIAALRKMHLSSVLRVVRDANLLSTSIFQSMLSILATLVLRSNGQISKWSVVSKLVHPKGEFSCDQEEKQEDVNELECVDFALTTICKQISREEIGIGRIEDALEGLYRCLIGTRTSLLNIMSQ